MRIIAAVMAAFLVSPAFAQEAPKVGPEIEMLAKRAGTWDTVVKGGGGESKGVMTWKMELGGLWLTGALDTEIGGQKYAGRSLDSYDAAKKKFVSVWVDSMGASPMLMEGTWNAAKKTMTMSGDGPGTDGKPAKWKSVSEMTDENTETMSMFVGDSKEPMFTMIYKRKK